MKLQPAGKLVLFILLFGLSVTGRAWAAGPITDPLPDFDKRANGLQPGDVVSADQRAAAEQLRVLMPTARVEFDPVTGAPKTISAGDKFLSGANGQGRAISATVAARFAGDPHQATKAFLREHRGLFGHGPEELDQARVKREFVTPHNGMKTVIWEQQVNDIPVFEAVLISHTTARGELVNLSSQFVPNPERAAGWGGTNQAPGISARKAVVIAAQNVGEQIPEGEIVPDQTINQGALAPDPEKWQTFEAKVFKGKAEARLVWLPMSRTQLRLCWDVILMSRTREEMFRVLVDAQTGEPLLRHCLTDYISEATYRVYTSDSPSPFSPGYSTPTTSQPPLVSRTLITLSALDTNASPAGWINDGGNETLGNNVDAHTDRNADNLPDLPRPQGSPFRVFDFPLDLTQSPATYTNAAVVQLFYWNNFMHDKLYELGFTEAAGNFQNNNFSRGGLGNDAVQADAQDGSGVNNANFSTPPDGSPGRMQMYLFTGPSPARDGDLDAEVVLHEYTHGLSNRRVGGGVGISALQSAGMGEGWSDFYAMALLSEPGDDVNGVYASGGYATYQLSGLTQNYYFGIRRYPYCTDTNKNPLTFKDIDPTQASTHTGVPRSPIIGTTANEVHNMGEVWCMTLREARANLINKYGWAVGNQLVLQLVTDGMNLSPANPNFLQARDAILQADQVDNNGANLTELWAAFAKRGMGKSATSPASSTTTGLHEAYDVPFQPLQLVVPVSATESDGVLAGAGQVNLPFPVGTDLVIALSSSDPSEATVPANATILAGQTNATFDLTIIDDGVLDGTQTATITASASGFANGYGPISVFDNETATLQAVLPATTAEGQGTVQGTVQVSAVPAANIVVSLFSSDPTEIQVPASVTIPAGQTSAIFTATVVDDNQIDGPQTATVMAHVQNWTDGLATVTVLDNENLNLTVTLPATAAEKAGVLTNAGIVSLSGTLPTNLVVSLVSGTPSKLIVPANVTIPAGQVSNTFNLTLVDNSIPDGHQTVTVTASAPSFTNGSASIFVIDDESPTPPSNPRPAHLATDVPANTNLVWNNGTSGELVTNGGFETGTLNNWVLVPGSFGHFTVNNGTFDPPSPDGPLPPYAGSFSALAYPTGAGIFYMYQDVSIPAGVSFATLSWAHRVRNFYTAFSASQQFQVRLCNTNNVVLATPFTTNPGDPLLGDWVQKSYDVTAYAGQKVRVMFWVNPAMYYLDVHVDNVSLLVNSTSGGVTNDVYFGTNPAPGPAEFQGSTTNSSWTLPLLSPLTTYYWQIVARKGGTATGPVWQFTTRGVDHFAWSPIASPQVVNQPINATVTAKDAFNTTVSNFNGTVSLQTGLPGAVGSVEDFESGIWPHAPWVRVAGITLGTVSASYAHDGSYGLQDPEWMYRTDVSLGNTGTRLSCWVRPTSLVGRAYLGFGASASGCWSAVIAPNTSQFLIQQNSGYSFTTAASASQTWQANKWYLVTIQFLSTSSVTCNLYDSDGTTLLNSLSGSGITGLPGGVAMRSFGVFSLDTIASGGSGGGGSGSGIPISPTNSGNFVNGAWNGNLTVLQLATNVTLVADDGNGHTGSSNPFNVTVTNDISISLLDSPDPVSAGASLTYTLTVVNTGPTAATGVMVTNLLPPSAAFVSAISSQGTCTQLGGVVTCNLGVVPGGTNATIAIVVVPTVAGTTLTNLAMVSRAEVDLYVGNNAATATTVVTTPAISIADAAVVEGNVGTTNLVFAVTLAAPSAQTITVNYATASGSAAAGSDYISTNNLLTFPPGITNGIIAVKVVGDTVIETDETFFVNLSSPANGTLARSQGVGTIINDDGFPGQVDHFTWGVVVSPQYTNSPFQVTISAWDALNNPVTSFTGVVSLYSPSNSIVPVVSDNFTNGIWNGSIAVLGRATNAVLVADDGNGHTGLSNPFDVVPSNLAPVILVQPTNQTIFVGGTAMFAVAADGTPPLNFQWAFNGTNIAGATSPTLTLTNVPFDQAGSYAVLVTNLFGSALSSNAVLTVNLPPPVPVITGFSPISGAVGISVTIYGTNLSPVAANNIVYFGAVRAVVNAASETNLVLTAPMSATYAPITETVNGLTAWSGQSFLPTYAGNGQINTSSLTGRIDLAELAGSGQIVIADLDGDGKPDLAAASGASHAISLYRNISTNGTLNVGSFGARVDLLVGSGVDGTFAVADVDGDGKLDLVAVDNGANQVMVLRNVSVVGSLTTSSFAGRVNFAVGSGPRGLAVQDLDGDGKAEIVTCNYGGNNISVLRNIGTAGVLTTNSFAPAVSFATGAGPQNVAIGDVDGDGRADLVTVNINGGTSQSVSVLRNVSLLGNLAFASEVDLAGLATSFSVAIGDLDGDGKLDLVVSSFNGGQAASVYRNVSVPGSLTTNSFAARVDFGLGGWGNAVALGDLDGDGKPDLLAVTQLPDQLLLFKNTSTPGNFTINSLAPEVVFSTGSNPNGVVIGDLDGDGRPDIAFANDYSATASVYQNAIPFGTPPVITGHPTNQAVTVGGSTTFSVTASGTLPLSYQWSFNGTNMVGATNTMLTLTNVQLSQAGNYAVLVTNAYGSILSSNAVLTVVPAGACVPVPPGLVGWWPAEDNANDNTGTNNGVPLNVTYANGEVGNAFVFDGASSSVRIPASLSLDVGQGNGFTMEGWINPANLNLQPVFEWNTGIPAGNPDAVTGVHLWISGGGPGSLFANLEDTALVAHSISSSNGVVTANSFQHVALTYDKTTGVAVLYRNGVVVATANLGVFTPQTSYNLYLGLRPAGTLAGARFQGMLDELSLYKRVLTPAEIQSIYAAGSGGKCFSGSPATITSQPMNQTVMAGSAAMFAVTASGTAPLSYQWNFNGTNIVGATNTMLTLTNVQLSQAGNYAVLVTNSFGSALSSNAMLTVNSPSGCTPAPSGLIGWWPAENNANDVAGGHDGILLNGSVFTNGEVGQTFRFSGGPDAGANPCIQIPYASSLTSSNYSMEAWVNPLGPVNNGANQSWIFGEAQGSQLLVRPGTTGVRVVFEFKNGGGGFPALVSTNEIPISQFSHVAGTWDGTTLRLYVNGVLNNQSVPGTVPAVSGCDFFIGGVYNPASGSCQGVGQFFNGLIDEVSYYNRALSLSEVQTIYTAGAGGKCVLPLVISSQPTNRVVAVGSTTTFVVAAGGNRPLSYQWNFNATNIVDATNATLILTNVQVSQAGNYTVLVTNGYGSLLSSNAALVVTLDHFSWNPIPSPRFLKTPFPVIIRAQDKTNGLFTNFNGTASLIATELLTATNLGLTPPISGNFVQGAWTGLVTISRTATNAVLRADDGFGHFGQANLINVLNLPNLRVTYANNQALFTWPVAYSGFTLETSDSLSPSRWVVVPDAPVQIGNQYQLPLDLTGTNGFYRLRFPGP